MRTFISLGRHLSGIILLTLVPAVVVAQSATPPADSAAARSGKAAGKRSRLGALGKAAVAKANSAATKVEQTTGVSKETMAKAALVSTGVGAATMLASPATPTTPTGQVGAQVAEQVGAQVGAAAGGSLLQRLKGKSANRAATPSGAMTAEQMALYQQQQQMALYQQQQQMALAQSRAMPTGSSAEMQRVQAEYTQIAMRASAGDQAAMQQMLRFQQEMVAVSMSLQGVAPERQEAVYVAAMRDALACATSGKSCRTSGKQD